MLTPSFHEWPTPQTRRAGATRTDPLAIVGAMSKTSGRRPFRTLLILAAAVGAVLAYRNAVADQGGSYDPTGSGSI